MRSSNYYEDQSKTTFAGKFESLLNIESKKKNNLIKAIEKVAYSYKNFKHSKNEILIQDMVKNVKYSGVIFTSDLRLALHILKSIIQNLKILLW